MPSFWHSVELLALMAGVVALVTVFQMVAGRPNLTFSAGRVEGGSGSTLLLLHIYNLPVTGLAQRFYVTRADAHFSVSIKLEGDGYFAQYTEPLLGSADPLLPNQFHLHGGVAPLTLRILTCDASAARIYYEANAAAFQDLNPGTYGFLLTAFVGERQSIYQRKFVVTEDRLSSYWVDT